MQITWKYFGIQSYSSELEALDRVFIAGSVIRLILREAHGKRRDSSHLFIARQDLALTEFLFLLLLKGWTMKINNENSNDF